MNSSLFLMIYKLYHVSYKNPVLADITPQKWEAGILLAKFYLGRTAAEHSGPGAYPFFFL